MTQTAAQPQQMWVSVARAARILHKSPSQVRRYIEEGKLRARRIGSMGWQSVAYEDVVNLLAPNSTEN